MVGVMLGPMNMYMKYVHRTSEIFNDISAIFELPLVGYQTPHLRGCFQISE